MALDEENKPYLMLGTESIKAVSDYTQINFNDILELDCVTFKLLLRDAFIYKMRKSEEGRDYLENCWLLTQKKPDKKKLREKFREEVKNV